MKAILTLLLVLLFGLFASPVKGSYDPLSVPNNLFGIHIADINDIPDAARLVNTNGDWGYVTFVITNSERNKDHWQRVFDELRRLHLIPIVRIATKFDGTNWEKPSVDEIDGWVSFLNELNWVVKNRYVVIGNEPNHAKEWGGEISAEAYASWLLAFSTKLKNSSQDYFILPAGLDASASNSRNFTTTMDETVFLERMIKAEPEIFNYIDGWTSHSYPNPAFAGSERDSGRGTIRTYEWEYNLLQNLGISKPLPVFITETGWSSEKADPSTFGEKFGYAFQEVWSDMKVVAVTPFVLSYKDHPFDVFSWKKVDNGFYDFYYDIMTLKKVSGNPRQIVSGEILGVFVPPIVLRGFEFTGYILAKNTGQTIWNKENTVIEKIEGVGEITSTKLDETEPGKTRLVSFTIQTKDHEGKSNLKVRLLNKGFQIGEDKDASFFIPRPGQITNDATGGGILGKVKDYLGKLASDLTQILPEYPL